MPKQLYTMSVDKLTVLDHLFVKELNHQYLERQNVPRAVIPQHRF
jgi:hypothetical protein